MDEEQVGGLRMTDNYPDGMDWGAYDDYFDEGCDCRDDDCECEEE